MQSLAHIKAQLLHPPRTVPIRYSMIFWSYQLSSHENRGTVGFSARSRRCSGRAPSQCNQSQPQRLEEEHSECCVHYDSWFTILIFFSGHLFVKLMMQHLTPTRESCDNVPQVGLNEMICEWEANAAKTLLGDHCALCGGGLRPRIWALPERIAILMTFIDFPWAASNIIPSWQKSLQATPNTKRRV